MRPLNIKTSKDIVFAPHEPQVIALGQRVASWDLATRKKTWSVRPLQHPSHVAFSPDGDTLAVKNCSGQINLLSADSGNVIMEFNDECEGARVCFHPGGQHLYSGTWGGDVFRYDLTTGDYDTACSFAGHMIKSVAYRAVDDTFIVHHSRKGSSARPPTAYVSQWCGIINRTPNATKEIELPQVRGVELTATRSLLVGHGTKVSKLTGHQATEISNFGNHLRKFAAHPSTGLYGAITVDGDVFLADRKHPEPRKVYELSSAFAIAFSGDASLMAVGGSGVGYVMDTPSIDE